MAGMKGTRPNNGKKKKLALVCTKGGHFEQMANLSDFFGCYDHFWITNKNTQTESQLKKERAYYIETAHFKKPWTYFSQVPPVLKIFAKERPTHVLSTGSGRTAFVPFLLSRLLNIKFLYIDTFSHVRGHTKFGTFLVRTRNKIYSQWEHPHNPNTVYIGPIFKERGACRKRPDANYVFVTAGTRDEPFTRLLQAVERLVQKGVIREKVIVQSGHTTYASNSMEIFDFCKAEKIDDLILNARYVITQESAGIGTQCLKYGTRFLVMPRDYHYGELPTKSDMNEDLHYRLEELGYTKVVTTAEELEQAIIGIDGLKTGFLFNNKKAISNLHTAMEEA
jgi:UDP-N-acetylglucosamine transferase subunit ALG13